MIWRHTWSLWILYFAWNLSKYFKSQIAHQVYNIENNIMEGLKPHFSLFWRQSHYEIIIFHANFAIPLLWVILSDLSVKSFLIIFFSVSYSSHHTTSSSSTFLHEKSWKALMRATAEYPAHYTGCPKSSFLLLPAT